MTLLLLLSTIIHNAYSIPTITKTAILTPFNQRNNGARVMFSVEESPVVDLWWDVHIKYSHTWQFILAADESFGIDTNWDSSITFTMNIPEIQTKELLFAFTTDNMQYISVSIPMDRIGRPNKIYPACSLISKLPVFGYGDISQIPATDRSCDIAGGDCLYWKDMLPSNLGFNNYAPITFTLKNNRRTNEIILYYRSDSFVQGFTQSCRFAQHFVSQPGIKIYISGDNIGELYSVSSFNITSQIQKPTAAPTYNPTQTPTMSTESPTHIPSQTPTFNPTRSTKNPSPAPTNYPTKRPTNFPSSTPTKAPTNIPSESPTNNPTGTPTKYPSTYPSITPTKLPTQTPTKKPTTNPTNIPTNYPTNIPTKLPTNNPTDISLSPTPSPSNFPSTTPTRYPTTARPTWYPTNYPTPSPTTRPTPYGYQYGAHNQLCLAPTTSINYKCNSNTEILYDTAGIVDCAQSFDCCQCKTIECGFGRMPCYELRIGGLYGAVGVKEIYVSGSQSSVLSGAVIDCHGSFACESAFISGTNIDSMTCDGTGACLNAVVIIVDPKPNFVLDCAGISSCEGLYIKIQFTLPNSRWCTANDLFIISKINCNAEKACDNIMVEIGNYGCDKVVITDLECIQPNSCHNAVFNLIGLIAIQNCHCGQNGCDTVIGLDEYCFAKNNNLINYLCSAPYQCAQQREIIENPKNGFEFICSATESCRDGNFVIELNMKANKLEITNYFNGILISGDYAAQGAKIVIDNRQGVIVNINKIECNGLNSCQFMTFIIGRDVTLQQFICAPDACLNCYIKQTETSPGVPCDGTQIGSNLLRV